MNLSMFFCPLFPRKIMWGFVNHAVYNSCWLVLLCTGSQRKPPSPASNRCSVSSEVVEGRVAVLYGISPRLRSIPLRLIQSHCSISLSINPLPFIKSGVYWLLYATSIPNLKSSVRYPLLRLPQNAACFGVNGVELHIPLWFNEKINFKLPYFVFIHPGDNCHCSDASSSADDWRWRSGSLL